MTIDTNDNLFRPNQIQGKVGQPVNLTLVGGAEGHTFTVPSLGLDVVFASRELVTANFVVPVAGTTVFYCLYHGSLTSGMHGLLIFD